MCTLRIYGADFDAESYLSEDTRLKPCAVFWPGVPVYDKRVARGQGSERGFHVGVSNREWSDWEGQVSDATAFLEERHEVLKELSEREDVESVYVDFPTNGDPDSHFIIWDRVFPASLLLAAGRADVAIELTVYVAPKDATHPSETEE